MSEESEDEDDIEDIPRVLLARVGDISKFFPEPMVKAYKARPIWFILGMDAELVHLFERIPEDPMQKGHVTALLGGLRAFATEKNDDLQRLLGQADEISFGFHVDATLARVTTSFEEDGFVAMGSIVEGEIVEGEIVVAEEAEEA